MRTSLVLAILSLVSSTAFAFGPDDATATPATTPASAPATTPAPVATVPAPATPAASDLALPSTQTGILTVANATVQLTVTASAVDEANARIKANADRIRAQGKDVKVLQGQVATQGQRLEQVEGQVADQHVRLVTVEGRVADQGAVIDALSIKDQVHDAVEQGLYDGQQSLQGQVNDIRIHIPRFGGYVEAGGLTIPGGNPTVGAVGGGGGMFDYQAFRLRLGAIAGGSGDGMTYFDVHTEIGGAAGAVSLLGVVGIQGTYLDTKHDGGIELGGSLQYQFGDKLALVTRVTWSGMEDGGVWGGAAMLRGTFRTKDLAKGSDIRP